jgi:hypothetical protein
MRGSEQLLFFTVILSRMAGYDGRMRVHEYEGLPSSGRLLDRPQERPRRDLHVPRRSILDLILGHRDQPSRQQTQLVLA